MLKWRFDRVAAVVAAVGLVVVVAGCGVVDHFRARVDLGSGPLNGSDSGCNDAVPESVPSGESGVAVQQVSSVSS